MKFFIPHASSEAEAESVLEAIAKFVGASVPPPDKRIFRMAYRHNGQDFTVEVGQPIPIYYREGNQKVIAILAGNPYLVCLPTRGVVQGAPIYVGASTVCGVEYFKAAESEAGLSQAGS